MRTKTRISVAIERLFFFAVFSLLFIHTISCLWIYLAVENMDIDNWIDTFEFNHNDIGPMYTIGMYWTVTTITTVGYGDISATNTAERISASIIMIIGVIAFSFSTGSLSSIIQTSDERQGDYRKRLEIVKDLKAKHKFGDHLYMELTSFINYQTYERDPDQENFLLELPAHLQRKLYPFYFEKYQQKIIFF